MQIAKTILWVLIALLSAAAGIAKIAKLPEEVAFFQNLGLADVVVVMFGAIQLLAGVLIVIARTRLAGTAIAAAMFFGSTMMLFVAGQISFAVFSLLPVVLADVLIILLLRERAASKPTLKLP